MSASPDSSSSIVASEASRPASEAGGLNLTWYDRPEALWTHRPQMRSVRISSATCSARTARTHSPVSARQASSICAWATVRGKPSRTNPCSQSDSVMRSLMMPTTMSSETSPPACMIAAACLPTSVPAATAARSMSPVESCGAPNLATSFGACVPLPEPGGPKRMTMLRPPSPAAGVARRGRGPAGACMGDSDRPSADDAAKAETNISLPKLAFRRSIIAGARGASSESRCNSFG
mmetsp:Transcript_14053/g.46870  ORF Transcript_14053/g.46870 Transcript_14053/m.46870 type:complete len:235 (+) Transcript_14053:201-905(+)